MNELDIDLERLRNTVSTESEHAYLRIRVSADDAALWPELLADAVRQCYITDSRLEERVDVSGETTERVLRAVLPDPGSTMSGDFGEILVLLLGAARERVPLIAAKKWRLKQDRNKPITYSDVVQFALPKWPRASKADRVLCSEVKSQAVRDHDSLIDQAQEGCRTDQLGRLGKTLVWLRDRVIEGNLGTVSSDLLDRFIESDDERPTFTTEFRAVAVASEKFEANVLQGAPKKPPTDHELLVVFVPDLKAVYESVYKEVVDAAREEASES